jgi:cytochrome o ubiquinol oxidase operon protein cyoD
MTEVYDEDHPGFEDNAPGDERLDGSGVAQGVGGYLLGLALAGGLTAASFYVTAGHFLYGPSIPAALIALAVAQMGVHLVFFLHITTGPESTNNVLALAFGVLIVFLLIAGTLFIMGTLNQHMPPMDQIMSMQR